MIKKYIPTKFDLTTINLRSIIENVIGKKEIIMTSDRYIIFIETPTNEQLQQIKTDFLNSISEVSEL